MEGQIPHFTLNLSINSIEQWDEKDLIGLEVKNVEVEPSAEFSPLRIDQQMYALIL